MRSNVVALDAGGATLKASVVVPYSDASATASRDDNAPFVLANHVATLASSSSSSAAVLMGQELLDKEQQGAKLRYVRPVERSVCLSVRSRHLSAATYRSHIMCVCVTHCAAATA